MQSTITTISKLAKHLNQTVTLQGWLANKRTGGGVQFLILRDGSGFCQCVLELQTVGEQIFEDAKRLTLESSLHITGTVLQDEKQVGGYEIQVQNIQIVSIAEEFPIGKKEHGVDFLMNNRHLWLRSEKQWAIMRIRNEARYAINQFFYEQGFIQMDSPILTGNACEGTTNLFETEYYKKEQSAYLSQSGQLYAEASAMAHGKVYTFGPTFRAERSVTPRHLSEFWMIEPEMAYFDLEMDMNLIEAFVKYVVNTVYEKCKNELTILERDLTLFENIKNKPFPRITYTDAADIIKGKKTINGKTATDIFKEQLAKIQSQIEQAKNEIAETETQLNAPNLKKGQINYFQSKIDRLKNDLKPLEEQAKNIPLWIQATLDFIPGNDFGAPDERAITSLFDVPVFVYRWPTEIKAFYMKRFEDDDNFVKGADLLAPEGFGEIVGGSERETDLNKLLQRIAEHELPQEAFEWYLDLRRFGSVPHAGFGLGFERLIMWLTGVSHIRETIPFPRYYGRLFP